MCMQFSEIEYTTLFVHLIYFCEDVSNQVVYYTLDKFSLRSSSPAVCLVLEKLLYMTFWKM